MSQASSPVPASPAEPITTGPLREEIRFATVMYGGISLCIYMNGITDQLWHMVCSTARNDKGDWLYSYEKLTPVEKVYRRLAQARSVGKAAVDCKFVVDILSGTSAGGINSLFLAKALSCEQPLDALANLWIREGDIALLINDSGSKAPNIPAESPPESLLNSQRMAQRLLEAFRAMEGNKPDPKLSSRLVERLDLFMTSTDLAGLDLSLNINSNTEITEIRHKAVFHFANDPDDVDVLDPDSASGAGRNDFVSASVPFLTFVARATSCIVPAFEPMRLSDIANLADDAAADKRYNAETSPLLFAPFYRDYWSNSRIFTEASGIPGRLPFLQKEEQKSFVWRAFGDGGYGNNYPFNWAIDALAMRGAQVAVDRKLIYVEPDPDLSLQQKDPNQDTVRPNVLDHISAAAGVKTSQTIREQIQRIRDRNVLLDHLSQVKKSIERSQPHFSAEQLKPYFRLRVSSTTDDLADLIALALGFEQESIYWEAIRYIAHALRVTAYKNEEEEQEFLAGFDIAFRLRQIEYAMASVQPDDNRGFEALKQARITLDRWKAALRLHLTGSLQPQAESSQDQKRYRALAKEGAPQLYQSIAIALGQLNISTAQLAEIVTKFSSSDDRADAAGRLVESHGLELVEAFKAALGPALKTVDDLFPAQDGEPAYLSRDAWLFPAYLGTGTPESTHIDLLRVSPIDCNTFVKDPAQAKVKLAGTGLGHFSGFFHPAWRGEDILWGRLDGAERIICTVLPDDSDDRKRLILQAQLAILGGDDVDGAVDNAVKEQHLPDLLPEQKMNSFRRTCLLKALDGNLSDSRSTRQTVLTWADAGSITGVTELFAAVWPTYYRVELTPTHEMDLFGRSLRVLGNILDHVAKDAPLIGSKSSYLVRVGQVIISVAKILTPGSIESLLYRHWLALLILIDAAVLSLGVFNSQLAKPGMTLAALTVIIVLGIEATRLAVSLRMKGTVQQTVARCVVGLLGLTAFVVFGGLIAWTAYSWFGRPSVAQVPLRVFNVVIPLTVRDSAIVLGSLLVFVAAWSLVIARPAKGPSYTLRFLLGILWTLLTVAGFATAFLAFGMAVKTVEPKYWQVLAPASVISLLLFLASGAIFGVLAGVVPTAVQKRRVKHQLGLHKPVPTSSSPTQPKP